MLKGILCILSMILCTAVAQPHAFRVDKEQPKSDTVFHSIQAAVDAAKPFIIADEVVMITIADGEYAEQIKLEVPEDKRTVATLALIAESKGEVILSGADAYSAHDFKYDREGQVYWLNWDKTLAETPLPEYIPPLAGMREMAFFENVRMQQTPSPQGMRKGSFHVHENGKLYMVMPEGGRKLIGSRFARIDITSPERTHLLDISGVSLVLRGIGFRYTGGQALSEAAVQVSEAYEFWAEDCFFNWNNDAGLELTRVDDVVIRRSTFRHNGFQGMRLRDCVNVALEGIEVSLNGWRLFDSRFIPDYHADMAALDIRKVADVQTFRIIVSENRIHGVYVENLDGQITFVSPFIGANNGNGVYIDYVPDGFMKDARVANNVGAGLNIAGHWRMEHSILFANGDPETYKGILGQIVLPRASGSQEWIESVIAGGFDRVPLVRFKGEGAVLPIVQNSGNCYYHYSSDDVFWFGDKRLSVDAWCEIFDTDFNSIYADPDFVEEDEEPEASYYMFVPSPDSPLLNRRDWPIFEPQRTQKEARTKYLGNE